MFQSQTIDFCILLNCARQLKPKFQGAEHPWQFTFGTNRDNDSSLGIQKGSITLSNEDLKRAFDPVINQIVKSCSRVVSTEKAEVMHHIPLLHTLSVV